MPQAPRPEPAPSPVVPAAAWAIWAAAAAARLGVALTWGVLPDEAYYWMWGQAPALGYYDHPPLLAWLLAPLPATVAVRLPGWALVTAGHAALVATDDTPTPTSALLAVLPPLWLFGTLATPDAPLLGLWMLAIAAARRGWWSAVAPLGALAFLAKYPGLAIAPLLWWSAPPGLWRRRDHWAGLALAAGLVLPHLAWSIVHGHPALGFQAAHGLGGDGIRWYGPLTLAGAQLALSGGVLGLAALAVLWQERGHRAWWVSAPILALFAAASLRAPSEANWVAPAWVGLALLLARSVGPVRRMMQTGVWVALLLSLLVVVHVRWPLVPSPTDPALRLHTGQRFAGTAAKFVQPVGDEPPRPVWTERYQEAAWLRFHLGLEARVWAGCGRPNQLDARADGTEAWFIRPATGGPPTCMEADWEVVRRRTVTEHVPDGRRVGAWDIFLLRRLAPH